MSSSASNPNPSRARRYQVKDGTTSSGRERQKQRDSRQGIETSPAPGSEPHPAGDGPLTSKSGSASSMTPNTTRTSPSSTGSSSGRSVRRSSTPKRRNEIPAKRRRHSASAQARRNSQQPSAGEPFLSSADHRTASGSDAGSAAPSGPVSARKDTPATQLSPDIQALIKLSVDQAAKEAFKAGMQYSQNATVKTVKGNIRSSVGDGNTRSIHATTAILATGGFIDACLPRADGEVPAEKIDRKNCHALAAMVQFVQWPNRDMDEAEDNLRNYVTPKRTDQLKQVKVAVRRALLSCGQTVADETVDEVPPLPRFEFYEQITRTILDVESDGDEVLLFMDTFFAYIWESGHDRIPHASEENVRRILDVYDADMMDLRSQIFVPVLLAAMSLLRVEIAYGPSRECGNCWAIIKSQIDDVFGPKGKSAKRTACERGFASQVWEISHAFMFGAGRPASFLMEMNPADIMPDDAIRAFTPHLSRTKDEGEQGDEDGARYCDYAAGSSAAAEPDRDEAKDSSSRASSDTGSPVLDPRGGNAADDSISVDDAADCPDDGSVDDAGDCPDDDDDVFGAGKGLTGSG